MSTIPDLYRPEAPQEMIDQVRIFIEDCNWKVAVTDKSPHPHSYCMIFAARRQGLIVGYSRMVSFLDQFGFERCWRNRIFKSIDLDGFSYWLQDLSEAHQFARDIINRKPAEHGGWNKNQPNLP
jgi:hypothetical protein